jgi:hypothetical protein
MPSSVLSPVPSTSTVTPSQLPKQRSHPLRAGSQKEATVISHVDKSILAINRRHAKKFSSAFEQPLPGAQSGGLPRGGDGRREADLETERQRGYESFNEVARDVESLVDVLWVSGTRTFTPSFDVLSYSATKTY